MPYYGFDSTYILVMIGVLIVGWAQAYVQSTFNKYQEWPTAKRVTGRAAAEYLLKANGIYDVRVEHVRGHLTDHYDPSNKILRLSDATYNQTSVAAVAVAAHECGHAIQDAQGYVPLKLRASMVPVVNFGSSLAMPMLLIGFILNLSGLITAGIVAFSLVLMFQLVTLPVEFDASRRALDILERDVFTAEEITPAHKVLRAAAFTYVASTLSTALQLFRFILLSNNRRED